MQHVLQVGNGSEMTLRWPLSQEEKRGAKVELRLKLRFQHCKQHHCRAIASSQPSSAAANNTSNGSSSSNNFDRNDCHRSSNNFNGTAAITQPATVGESSASRTTAASAKRATASTSFIEQPQPQVKLQQQQPRRQSNQHLHHRYHSLSELAS